MRLHKITICGGGNGAQTLAPIAARNLDCLVDLYAPLLDEAERLTAGISAHDGLEVIGAVQVKARPRRISAKADDVIPGSEIVVLVLPAFAHESILREIVPYVDAGAWLGAMPARGGFDYCAVQVLHDLGREDIGLFGLQTLPWACRIQEYGQVVHVLGVKDALDAAGRPVSDISEIVPLLEQMLGLPIGVASNLLALTLANTGQLIHPGIMYGLFASWDGASFEAKEVPLFYQGLTAEGARTLAALSDEVQAIRAVLESAMDLSAVRPLETWLLHSYGTAITDPSSLWSAFVTNRAYTGLKAPVREVAPGRFVPDFTARYLAEDVPFGLVVSRAIARLASVETATMDSVIAWAGARLGKDWLGRHVAETRIPQRYGLETVEQLTAFAAESEG
jgi:hypothetical protein